MAKQSDLTVKFNYVQLPNTINFGDDGKVKVTITNDGNQIARGPIALNLWSSIDDNIDKNDVVLASKTKKIKLKPGQSKTLTLKYDNITSAIAPGAYNLIAEVDANNQIVESNENNNVVSELVSGTGTDVVIDWVSTALNAIQMEGEAGRGAFGPTRGTRAYAILSTSVYNAVNAFEETYTPYGVDVEAPQGASIESAAVGAAYEVLSTLIPEQTALFDQQKTKSLAEIQDLESAETIGFEFGASVAQQILALRENDGSNNNTPYVAPDGNYIWHPDPPNFNVITPNWGSVTPWAIDNVDDFSPDGIDGTYKSDLYAEEIEEVRLYGGRENTEVTTLLRNEDQTEIAVFWANDRIDTFRPNGQLLQIATEVATREGNSVLENARLFAALNVALADVAVTAWANKFEHVQPRPDDVIAGGIAADDDLVATVPDPDWQPLLDTPSFPDYISGHTTLGGGFAGVMTHFFGDNYEFDAVSQELPGVVRHFESFEEAGLEDGLSRIYGGIHVREATVTDAFPTGFNIGDYVASNFFQPQETTT
ncbi:MAG: CARDB domain-containing protein [Crocosphaera sp.]|nr:CARDB domain-containing protein [Crocosphaera sp.]